MNWKKRLSSIEAHGAELMKWFLPIMAWGLGAKYIPDDYAKLWAVTLLTYIIFLCFMISHYKRRVTDERYDYDAAMFEISELVRVAVTNREGLDDFISWNFPKEKAAALARKERNL